MKKDFSSKKAYNFFHNFPYGLIVLSDGKIIDANGKAEKIFDMESKDLRGRKITDFIHPDFLLNVKDALEMAKVKDMKIECKLLTKYGYFNAHLTFFPVGENIFVVIYDTEERKEMQNILHNLKERIKILSCLHDVEIISRKNASLDEILKEIAEIIPRILQHPELAHWRLTIKGIEYFSPNYVKTDLMLSADIVINGRKEGIIEIGYTQPVPAKDGKIFSDEEKEALQHIAMKVANIVEYMEAKNEIQRSKEYFQALVEESSDIIMVIDKEAIIEYISPSIKKFLSFLPEEAVGRSVFEFIHPEDLKPTMDKFREVLENPEKVVSAIIRVNHKEGGYRVIEVKARNLLENPVVRGIVANFTDITELIEKEKKLRENERKLRALIDATHDLVILFSPDGTILDLNEAMAKSLGKKKEEIIGRKIARYKHMAPPHIFESRLDNILKVVKTKKPLRCIDYRNRWFDNHFYPIFDEKGNVAQIAIFARDITDLKEAEERFRQVVENTNEWIWEVNADGLYTYSSPAVKKILGYKPDEIVGKKYFYDLFHPKDRERLKKEIFELFGRKKPFKGFLSRNIHKNGEERWLIRSGVPILDANGELKGYRGLDFDLIEKKKAVDALRESEEKFRILAENSPSAIFICKAGRVVYANKRAEEITGYKKKEMYSSDFDFFELLPPDKRRIMKELQKNDLLSHECKLFGKNGEKEVIINSTIIPYGKENAILNVITDITELKKAQSEIRKLNEYLNSIIENANVWLDVLDRYGNVVIWNKAAEEISGYKKNEVVGHAKIWEWLYPDEKYRNKIFNKAMAIIEKGEIVEDFETVIKTKRGEKKIISWYSRNLVDENGKPIGSVAIGRDVTKQREAEKMTQTLINAAHDLVILIKTDGIILNINEAMAKSLGKKREEVIGTNSMKYLPLDKEKINEVKKTKGARQFIYTYKGRWYDTRLYPIFDEYGNVSQIAIFSRDITEQKEMEEKLMHQRKLAALGRLAAVVAHELNTPLANIAITAEYLMEKMKGYKEELEIIKREVENASSIIKNVLQFSRMKVAERKEIDVGEIIDKAIDTVRRIYHANDTIFQNRVRNCRIVGDEQRLKECFINIIKNAVMARDENKKSHYVIVDASEEENELEIRVRDNGVGMDEKVVKDALKPFFTTRSMGEGTGLGLFIANWIAEEHGGKIEIKSKKGEGTEVKIKLRR